MNLEKMRRHNIRRRDHRTIPLRFWKDVGMIESDIDDVVRSCHFSRVTLDSWQTNWPRTTYFVDESHIFVAHAFPSAPTPLYRPEDQDGDTIVRGLD